MDASQLTFTEIKQVARPLTDTNYYLLKDGGLYFEQRQRRVGSEKIFDTFANHWSIASATIPKDYVCCLTRGQSISVDGHFAVLVPPFTLLQWEFRRPIEFTWRALAYRCPYPESLPREALLFPLGEDEWPTSVKDIENLFIRPRPSIKIDKMEEYNLLAIKLKKNIDLNFLNDKDIVEYAADLNVNRDVLTRYFKRCYGLAPIEYRNRMRLFHAMISLLLDSGRVLDVSERSGFRNLKNFNKQFYNYLSIQPSKLLSSK